MRTAFALLTATLLAVTAPDALGRADSRVEHAVQAPMPGEWEYDIPARAPGSFARSDTISFGNYQIIGDEYYAVQGGVWNFEDGADGPGQGGPSLQGWYGVDLTTNPGAWWRHITADIWSADPWNPSYVPLINGPGSVWIGLFASEARDLCWPSTGAGYGNNWCQRLTSPVFTYEGSGDVNLSMEYWNDTEPDYDYSMVVLQVGQDRTVLNAPGFTGQIGFDPQDEFPGGAHAATYDRVITQAEFGGSGSPIEFEIIFEFVSDGGWSDQDGHFVTGYGPWAVDDLILSGSIHDAPFFDWDDGLQGWTPSACPGVGSFLGVGALSDYVILDPCVCGLDGHLMHLHNQSHEHFYGQRERAWSPIVDRTGIPNYTDYNRIFADWDMYADLPMENGVFYRSLWSYYPWTCESTGQVGWSPHIATHPWWYPEYPICFHSRSIGTDWGLPPDAEMVRFGKEIFASCDAFGIPNCSYVTNATPLFDNFRVRMTSVVNAPGIALMTGCRLHDAFGATGPILNINDAANVKVTRNLRSHNPALPPLLGDSLAISGPAVVFGQGRWESRLWFRLARTGPGQAGNALYNTWRNHPGVNKGFAIESGEFSYGLMDSAYSYEGAPMRHQFASYFNENDSGFMWGGGDPDDTSNENAILPNLAFTPGTKIEYFITGDYTEDTPPGTYSYLPDTTGGFFLEFEILPGFRMEDGVPKFPAVLYIDAYNRGAQPYIERALNMVMAGADWDDPVPDPAPWDRYDYLDASSNWKAPMYRAIGGNNGATLPQMAGYRAIILNTGTFGGGCMWPADWQLFQDWITYPGCDGNALLKGFIANGTNISHIMSQDAPGFMTTHAGVSYICNTYNADGCPPGQATDENYCVQLEVAPGAVWTPEAGVDVFGNWCPPMLNYDVLGTAGGGMGNKVYQNVVTGLTASYSQVVKDASAEAENYRVVVDGFSYHTMTMRDLEQWPDPELQCPVDDESRVVAACNELREQLKWVLNMSDPMDLGLTVDPCGGDDSSVPGGREYAGMANRLNQNHPNPFNPRTTISFSLAQAGPTKLFIFDVAGRKVRTLVDGDKEAGFHSLIWDGLDDSGRPVASGLFWSQLSVEDFSSNRKMVVLK